MDRLPEPELMDDEAQARAYSEADFSEPHQWFVTLFRERFPRVADAAATVLDLGCGPADVTVRFAEAHPKSEIVGVDGSEAMLRFGRRRVASADLASRVTLELARLPGEPPPEGPYDVVVSNSLLHHLADPAVLWDAARSHARPGASIFVMDLIRPASRGEAERLVRVHSGDEPEVLRRDFFHSLLAAYRTSEVEGQIRAAGLQLRVEAVSDRHFVAYGRAPS